MSQNPYSCVRLSSESQGKRSKYHPLTGSVVSVKTSQAPVHLHVLCLCTECHSVKKSVIVCTAQAGVVSPQVYQAQSSIVSRSVGTTSWTTLYHVDCPVSDKCIWLIVAQAIASLARSFTIVMSCGVSNTPSCQRLRGFIHHLFESSLTSACRVGSIPRIKSLHILVYAVWPVCLESCLS